MKEKVFAVIIKLRQTGEQITYHVYNMDDVISARQAVVDNHGGDTNIIRCLACQIQ